jgi:uroporphyrinogen decarboxylase
LSGVNPPDYLPDTIGYGSYSEFFKHIKHIKEAYNVYIVAAVWGSHWEKAYFSRGIENFLADLAGNTEWAQELLDLIIRKNIVMLENIMTASEIDAVLLGSDWGTQRGLIMSPDCFRKMIKPGEKQEYDLIKKYGKKIFVHSCGDILAVMDDLVELGVDCLNPVQPECMDISLLKNKYGAKISYYGGISTQDTLPFGSADEVRAETRNVIELMSVNGGYITAPSQEIQTDVSYENLCALIDTAREYI